MATIDIAKLQANLMTDNTTGDNQVLESTIMSALPVMFGEMPSAAFTNQTGSEDTVGNVTYYKTVINEHVTKDFTKVGDISRFRQVSTDKVLVALETVIENPVTYYSAEIAMSAQGILGQVEAGITGNMAEAREIGILTEEYETANAAAATQIKTVDFATAEAKDIERVLDDAVTQIRGTKDTGISKVSMNKIVIKVAPKVYRRLLDVKLVIPGTIDNETTWNTGSFQSGKFKGVAIVEDAYLEDANEALLATVTMIGAIAAPWRSEGVANDKVQGESTMFLLNPQVRFAIKAIYSKHIIAIIDGEAPVVEAAKPSKALEKETKL